VAAPDREHEQAGHAGSQLARGPHLADGAGARQHRQVDEAEQGDPGDGEREGRGQSVGDGGGPDQQQRGHQQAAPPESPPQEQQTPPSQAEATPAPEAPPPAEPAAEAPAPSEEQGGDA